MEISVIGRQATSRMTSERRPRYLLSGYKRQALREVITNNALSMRYLDSPQSGER